jgi:hypothetical protein
MWSKAVDRQILLFAWPHLAFICAEVGARAVIFGARLRSREGG